MHDEATECSLNDIERDHAPRVCLSKHAHPVSLLLPMTFIAPTIRKRGWQVRRTRPTRTVVWHAVAAAAMGLLSLVIFVDFPLVPTTVKSTVYKEGFQVLRSCEAGWVFVVWGWGGGGIVIVFEPQGQNKAGRATGSCSTNSRWQSFSGRRWRRRRSRRTRGRRGGGQG